MSEGSTCTKEVHNGERFYSRWGPCGKPCRTAEQNAAGLCGLHLGAQKRSEAAAKARETEAQDRTRNYDAAQRMAAALEDATGERFGVTSAYHGTSYSLTLDMAKAYRVLELLAVGPDECGAMVDGKPCTRAAGHEPHRAG